MPPTHKRPWSEEEDNQIVESVAHFGKEWSHLAANLSGRSRKEVYQRWIDQLDPNINKGKWSPDEDARLVEAQAHLGNVWTSEFAQLLPGRTRNDIRNRWTSLELAKKKALARAVKRAAKQAR